MRWLTRYFSDSYSYTEHEMMARWLMKRKPAEYYCWRANIKLPSQWQVEGHDDLHVEVIGTLQVLSPRAFRNWSYVFMGYHKRQANDAPSGNPEPGASATHPHRVNPGNLQHSNPQQVNPDSEERAVKPYLGRPWEFASGVPRRQSQSGASEE
jgi:hypothetical protein